MGVTRSSLALAALATAAVPGLEPTSVQEVRRRRGDQFQVAFISDSEGRAWVVRSPLTAAAGAQLDRTEALLRLLGPRLPFQVPLAGGHARLPEQGRAAVYPYLEGSPVDWAHLPAGPGLGIAVGQAVARLHNIPRELFEEAGMPSYDTDEYRTRKLTDLDRAAETGHVPTGLLARWEQALEEVSLWRFAPTPSHGHLAGRHVLATFADPADAGTGTVSAVTGWERAQVADPADDFAWLVSQATSGAFDTVLEAYAQARTEEPDRYLEQRARLAAELQVIGDLLAAVSGGDEEAVADRSDRLRRLDAATSADDSSLVPRSAMVGAAPVMTAAEPDEPTEDREPDDPAEDREPDDPAEAPSAAPTPAGDDSRDRLTSLYGMPAVAEPEPDHTTGPLTPADAAQAAPEDASEPENGDETPDSEAPDPDSPRP